tara:strand:+ start:2500 stop:3690 length:1191 start_codon:yes stop_codon:yes gene_type:complete
MYTGPKLTNDDLVFGYDTGYGVADNATSTRFYPGEPTTNLYTNSDFSNNGAGWTFSSWDGNISHAAATLEGPYGEIVSARKLTVNAASSYSHFHQYNGSKYASGNTYTTSAWVKGNGVFQIKSHWGGNVSLTLTGEWQRISQTVTASTSASNNFPYLAGESLTVGTDCYVTMCQTELKGNATPYVHSGSTTGSRSNTTSLIDLKGETDINVSSVSFTSTGQPDFDGTDDEIQIASSDWNKVTQVTVEAIVLVKGTPIDGNGYHVVAQKDGAYSGGSVYGIRISGANVPYGVFSKDSTQAGTHINTVAGTTMTTNKYYHLVYTRKVGESVFYQNGEQKSINTSSNDVIYNNTSTFTIGQGDGRQLYGNIPVLKVHNSVLSATEIADNFNAYKNRFNI